MARLTLSLPDWKQGRVAPAVFEVPIEVGMSVGDKSP